MAKQKVAVKAAPVKPVATKEIAVEQTSISSKPSWPIKDRSYYLAGNKEPLTFRLNSRHSYLKPLLYFDEENGVQKELRYATNQNSPFVQEQSGEATLGQILFENGILSVPKQNQNLQKLLSLYHPDLNKKYHEFDAQEEALDDLEDLEIEFEAISAARSIDIDQAEAILRVEKGSEVANMSSKEIKRDLYIFAKSNPSLFLELANDENVHLRNVAIKATEAGIISLSGDNRTFNWASNDRKLMTVPFDENPYSAMAAFFKTDEGMEVFRSIEKKLI
tara:strand:- start:662 stop:1492 length:831 start_codon:yes stop_codon:yes gene_type:complete